MLYRENEIYQLMPYVASYTQHGETHEQHVAKKEDIQAFADMGHIADLSFGAATYSNAVLARLQEVENYPESEFATVEKYVLENDAQEGTPLALKKQNEFLEQSILELAMMQMGGVLI